MCLTRCCPVELTGDSSLECKPSNQSDTFTAGLTGLFLASSEFLFLTPEAPYSCPDGSTLYPAEDVANFTILDNGTILGEYPYTGLFPTHPNEYCVADHDFFWYCSTPSLGTSLERFRDLAYPALFALSSICALFTLVIYYRDDSLGSTMFGKMVMFFLANVAGAYFVLSFRDFFVHINTICTILGYLSQYTLLSMVFWMNVLAFRVFLTFTKSMPAAVNSSGGRKKLFLSCFYAQGVPAVICVITALADQLVGSPEWRPNMGEARCFLSCHSGIKCAHTTNKFIMPMFIYFESFQLVINMINLILLIITSYHLVQQFKEASKIQRYL